MIHRVFESHRLRYEENSIYRLMIPNKEIKRIYTTIFEEWFQEQVKEIRTDFTEALRREDVNLANELLNTILFESISYFDYDEKFYQCMLVGLFSNADSFESGSRVGKALTAHLEVRSCGASIL